ncbi:MAG: polymerase sigma factor, sigma-70 family [Planctomycetota bacterium]|nr:polymerase sigma factor, sigma-70 family [Planctomycetota bacterium]
MANGTFGEIGRQVQRLYGKGTISGLSESQLLDRFLVSKDEVAFEALVARHGPMVLAVCRRVLRDPHAADDAFQATFLLLVRKAASIRGTDLLGPWLHRVAYRVAVRAGRNQAKRQSRETSSPDAVASAPAVEPVGRELRLALHEVVDSLPEKYRAPVVLCFLEGRTHDEAARRLQWPIGSVKGRLSRAKEVLKARLERRGLTVLSGAMLGGLAREARAAVPVSLREKTICSAMSTAAGKTAVAGTLSASAAVLVQETARAMMIKKLSVLAASLAGLFFLVGGAAVLARQDGGKGASDRPANIAQAETRPSDAKPGEPKSDLDRLQGRWERTDVITRGNRLAEPYQSSSLRQISIKNDQLFGTNDDGEPAFPRTLKLAPSAAPKTFEWRRIAAGGAEETSRGIYQLDETSFTICMDPSDPLKAPADFETQPNDSRIKSVFRRAAPDSSDSEEVKAELRKLQGAWLPVSGERDGEASDVTTVNNPLQYLVFQGNARSLRLANGGLVNEKRFRLNLLRTPRVMELRPEPSDLRRIRQFGTPGAAGMPLITRCSYKLDGDTLVICSYRDDSATAPPELVTRQGDRRTLTVYRRTQLPPANVPASNPAKNLGEAVSPVEARKKESPEPSPKGRTEEPAAGSISDETAGKILHQVEILGVRRDALQSEIEDEESQIDLLRDRIQSLSQVITATETAQLTGNVEERMISRQLIGDERAKRLDLARKRLEEVQTKMQQLRKDSSRHHRDVERLDREIANLTEKAANARPGKPGTVQIGDTILVEVLEALPGRPVTGERVVRPDGTIGLGFYGDLKVQGLTRREIKTKVVEHMAKFLTDEILGLWNESDDGKRVKVDPADSDRVFVDDTQYPKDFAPRPRGATNEVLEKKLDQVIRELRTLSTSAKPKK